jgi:hypothetical protein
MPVMFISRIPNKTQPRMKSSVSIRSLFGPPVAIAPSFMPAPCFAGVFVLPEPRASTFC